LVEWRDSNIEGGAVVAPSASSRVISPFNQSAMAHVHGSLKPSSSRYGRTASSSLSQSNRYSDKALARGHLAARVHNLPLAPGPTDRRSLPYKQCVQNTLFAHVRLTSGYGWVSPYSQNHACPLQSVPIHDVHPRWVISSQFSPQSRCTCGIRPVARYC
jgi:hypothetical protein